MTQLHEEDSYCILAREYEKAGIGGMTNESVGTRFNHGLLWGDGHRRREGSAEHMDGVETERDPRVHHFQRSGTVYQIGRGFLMKFCTSARDWRQVLIIFQGKSSQLSSGHLPDIHSEISHARSEAGDPVVILSAAKNLSLGQRRETVCKEVSIGL